jgi:hypothetical protein
MVVRAAPERQQPSTPDYEALAADVVQEGLHERAVSLDLVRACHPEPVPAQVDGPLIIIGGPGSHRLSEATNQVLAQRAWGVAGLLFRASGRRAHSCRGCVVAGVRPEN